MKMKPETIDMHKKCVLVAIYCGLWYHRKDILEKYEIGNVSDLILLLLNGNHTYPSLLDALNDKKKEIDQCWKTELEKRMQGWSPIAQQNHWIKYNNDAHYKSLADYADGNNMLEKSKELLQGSIKFDLLLYVGMYFNIHFTEILLYQDNNENDILNALNTHLIPNPDNVVVLHTCIKHETLHQFYKEDVDGIEQSIVLQFMMKEEMESPFFNEDDDDDFDFDAELLQMFES